MTDIVLEKETRSTTVSDIDELIRRAENGEEPMVSSGELRDYLGLRPYVDKTDQISQRIKEKSF